MRSFITTIGLCSILLSVGCGGLLKKNEGVTGKSTKLEEKAHDRLDAVNDEIVNNDRQKLLNIGMYATGTDYALSKVVEQSKEIEVAREINSRIITLTDPPNLEQLKSMHAMVDNLVSILAEQKQKGLKSLASLDDEINKLQVQKKILEQAKNEEIKRYMDVAQRAASQADQYAATLGDMDSMWGLGAVFYGIKKFITRAFTFLSIFVFLYLALRVLATMHPAGAAAFQIFDMVASVFINIIKALAPGAAKIAKLVPEATSTMYKQTLGHVVSSIETLKEKDEDAIKAGQPVKKYTISEILDVFRGTMDRPNKDVIDDVKSEIKNTQ